MNVNVCSRIRKSRNIYFPVTHKCNQKKATGCYSFDVTNSTIDQDQIAGVEIWIYKQPDVNDHHLQVNYV